MKNIKVKISGVTEEGLKRAKEINIRKAQFFYQSCPFSTKVYMAMKTKLSMDFINNNWEEITSVIDVQIKP